MVLSFGPYSRTVSVKDHRSVLGPSMCGVSSDMLNLLTGVLSPRVSSVGGPSRPHTSNLKKMIFFDHGSGTLARRRPGERARRRRSEKHTRSGGF